MAGMMQYFVRELLSNPWYPDPGKPPYLLYYSCFGERITVTCIQFFASWLGTELIFTYIFLPLSLRAWMMSQVFVFVFFIEWVIGRRNAKISCSPDSKQPW